MTTGEYRKKEDYIHNITPGERLTHVDMVTCKNKGLLDRWKQKTILHVGCNSGSNSIVLSKNDINVIGLDINEKALERARQNVIEYKDWVKGGIKFINANVIGDLKEVNDKIEGLFCSNVLEHLFGEDIPRAVNNMYDILEPGSHYYISVPYKNSYEDPHHEYTFNGVEMITDTFKDSKVEIIDKLWTIIGKK